MSSISIIKAEGVAYHKYEIIYSAGKLMMLRSFLTVVTMLLLWINSDSSKVFFNSLAVFSMSQLIYSFSITCRDTIRKVFGFISIFIILIVAFVALGGLLGGMAILPTDAGYMLSIVRSYSTSYVMNVDTFIYLCAGVLIILHVSEWGTGWFSEMRGTPQVIDKREIEMERDDEV